MLYLVSKILILLLIAAVLGFVIGWYLRQYFMQKVTSEMQMDYSKNQGNKTDAKLDVDASLEKPVRIKKGQKASASESKMVKDNLQKINGIGTLLETRLNQLGIYSFEQISKWNNADIEKISKNIGPFHDRIKRDNWIKQAKKLSNQN